MNEIEHLQQGLDALAAELGPSGSQVRHLKPLSGGASQETWSFILHDGQNASALVMRRGAKGARPHENNPGLENEARLMQLAGEAGVPSPPIRLVLRPEHGLGRGFIMGMVDGETIPRKILRDPTFQAVRPRLARDIGGHMARIHGIAPDRLPPLRHADAATRLDDLERRYLESDMPRPVFELAILWLRDNLPAPTPPRLVHGDLRNGNMIIDAQGVQAVLDWEISHLGDPMEDLGWICVNSWRFGQLDLPVGGFGTREELFAGYEAVTGAPVDRDRVRFWETLGSFSWGVGCAQIGVDRNLGADRPLERAMIGRRASECEIDLLRLLTGEA